MRKVLLGLLFLGLAVLLGVIFYKAWAFPETRDLPYYALRTLLRLAITYVICLAFGLVVGIAAATRERFGNLAIPFLDILQSVPVLGFFPIALSVIISAFHGRTLGLELASLFLLFTSMEWSIVFGVIAGIKSMPPSISDMSRVFHISGWDYLKHILLPAIYPSIIAGSMLAWGSGWYFVIATEYITFGDKVYTLPGLGYYLDRASYVHGSVWMSLAGLVVIGAIVFAMHRLVWHRLNERAKEYRFLALTGFAVKEAKSESFWTRQAKYINSRLDSIQGLHLPSWFLSVFRIRLRNYILIVSAIVAVVLSIFYGVIRVPISGHDFANILTDAGYSVSRLLAAYLVALAVAISLGLLILQRPGAKNTVVIFADIMQSIPALAYFPLLFLIFTRLFPQQVGLEISAILLMLAGMMWYLVLNVIEAVEHWPAEINELTGIFDIRGSRYLKHIVVPALFPAIITGSILAWGGGWNATIVSEYVNIGHRTHYIAGLGSALNLASNAGDTARLLVILATMIMIVIVINHFIWRRLLSRASTHVLEEK